MKITGLFEKNVFKFITFKEFIILNKVFISDKLVTLNKILSNTQKYKSRLIKKIKDLCIYLILKLLSLPGILFNCIVKVLKLLYDISKVNITWLSIYL